ncbi:MFS transporter [Leptolyngbya iicbica LK]|uniref:MFS transporter n=2 Tax=Cyanophyceae TaxID=3028117 RepID=A0A4Q7E1B9_9CYAN|nr:MFS transporter [Leptolyngbya sp. LK]
MQGAIALMWVIYNLYLVELLTQVGLPQTLATALLVVENLLAMVMEPLMGSLSDRFQQQLGTRFPLISLGAILAAGAFLALPIAVLGGWAAAARWILPLMLVLWALTMTIFRSPAMSLLGRYAFGTRLPQAASVLTLVGGVAGAMGPLASERILSWGPVTAFALGSVVLLVAAFVLRVTAPEAPAAVGDDLAQPATQDISIAGLALIFGAGVGVTLGFRSLMLLFSRVLNGQVPDGNPSLVLGTVFVTLALTAIPAGVLAVRLGNRRAMVLGLAALAFVSAAIAAVPNNGAAIALAILFGAAFSLVSNGTIPFALSLVPSSKAGLGTGMFFSGGAAASSLFGTVAAALKTLPVGLPSLVGIVALVLAGSCIMGAPRRLSAPVSDPVES